MAGTRQKWCRTDPHSKTIKERIAEAKREKEAKEALAEKFKKKSKK